MKHAILIHIPQACAPFIPLPLINRLRGHISSNWHGFRIRVPLQKLVSSITFWYNGCFHRPLKDRVVDFTGETANSGMITIIITIGAI